MSPEDQPERVLLLRVPACEPERTLPEYRTQMNRLWQSVFAAVQRAVPGAVELAPGHCAMRARGPTRYYGSEEAAAQAVLSCIDEAGNDAPDGAYNDGSKEGIAVGIANGSFAAMQAAYGKENDPYLSVPSPGVHLVSREHTAQFLSGLPIARAAREDLAVVLLNLGIHTLGAFASLPEHSVRERFGDEAYAAHRRARGLGELHGAEVRAGSPPHDLSVSFEFEPPLSGVDQLAFACSTHAEKFVRTLGALGLVCTELRVELVDDTSTSHVRAWSHPANFTAIDIVNRVRWQAAKLPLAAERGGAGIAAVRLEPERTARAAAHEPGLWNNAPAEKVHHQLTRVQSLLGPEGVGTGVVVGGRINSNRQQFTPWGTEQAPTPHPGPWPGHLTGPLPNLLCPKGALVALLDEQRRSITIDDDELLSGAPVFFGAANLPQLRVRNWSAPWPLRERWWEAVAAGTLIYRLQVELDDGTAWLLRFTPASGWTAEGCYA